MPVMSGQLPLPNQRNHTTTEKVRIAGHRVLYLTDQDNPNPKEVFLQLKGPDVTAETMSLYHVVARLLSVSLQYGGFPPLEKMADLLSGAKFGPCGPVSAHG